MTPGERSCHGQKNSAQESLSAAQVRAGNREDGSMMMSAHVTAAETVAAATKAVAATTEATTTTQATKRATVHGMAAKGRAAYVMAGKAVSAE